MNLIYLNSSANREIKDFELRVYRFWAYETGNNVPSETVYFLKMLQIMNYNNPIFTKNVQSKKGYPMDEKQITNYLLHSGFDFPFLFWNLFEKITHTLHYIV